MHRLSAFLPVGLAVIVFVAGTATRSATAQEWTRFRGPNGSGTVEAGTVPVTWKESDLSFKVELPGRGHGAPVLWGDRLFVNAESNDGKTRILLCLDAKTGQTQWKKEFTAKGHRVHKLNSFATSTPAVDELHVYIAWGTPDELIIKALKHTGEEVWTGKDLGAVDGNHGFGASPIVYKDLVVLANVCDSASHLLAVKKATGDIAWKIPRNDTRLNYSTPVVFARPGKPDQLVFSSWQSGIVGVDPVAGKVVWEKSVYAQKTGERSIGSPLIYRDLVIATSAFANNPKHLVAVRPGDSGKLDDVEEVYRIDDGFVPHIPTCVLYNDRIYLWSDKGIVTCINAANGTQVWQKRVGGNFFGSPVCISGKLYAVDDAGEVVILQTGDEFVELGRVSLNEECRSTPAVAHGRLYIRLASHLIAVGGSK